MARVADVLQALDRIAPPSFALPGDRVGLQVGSPNDPADRVVVSLDWSLEVARHCRKVGAGVLLCHHPLIWTPLARIDTDSGEGAVVAELIRGGVAFVAAHTNWDCAPGGVNDTLASLLGLKRVRPFGKSVQEEAAKVVVFVPLDHANAVIDAMSASGAGEIGEYSRCAFTSHGTGTFIAGPGASPAIGQVGGQEEVEEVRVEMRVPTSRLPEVLDALIAAHPYEEPAYDVFPLRAQPLIKLGRVGTLEKPSSLAELVQQVGARLGFPAVGWGDPASQVTSVAVVGGSGADQWQEARSAGAEVLVTGEVPQHEALAAGEAGFCLVQAGHYATENPGARALAQALEKELAEIRVEVEFYEPEPGLAGRPLA